MPSKLKKAIGAVKDRTSISLAKVSAATSSSDLEVAVLKATTHDDVPVDERYVHQVVHLVSSNKLHAAACARAIGKRIGSTRNWIVALKSLMLVLRLFQDGDPYFPREVLHKMKRGTKILNLSSFRDDSNSYSPWDFSSFVRTFAVYLDERLECFLIGKLQRRYTHGTKEKSIYQWAKSSSRKTNEPLCDTKPAMLLDKISYWQGLLQRAIATRPTGAAKTNRLVQASLYAIVQESFELYKDISDGLSLVLDSFFHLQFQNCVCAFQMCIRARQQFKELSDFYSLCKSLDVGRSSEYPSVQTISEELLDALQDFLKDHYSFPSTTKLKRQLPLAPSLTSGAGGGGQHKASSTTEGSSKQSSEVGSPYTPLEDLISATKTGTCPAISIDLEAYPAPKQDDEFRTSDARSTRSLPVSSSMTDLMSMLDWSEQEENDDQQKGSTSIDCSSDSKNWELVLVETMSSSASSPPPALEQPARAEEERSEHSTKGWEVVLFQDAESYYNPFLQDTFQQQDMSSVQPTMAVPTFHAKPAFSMQSRDQTPFAAQNENDPFGVSCCASFPSDPGVFGGSVDQQNLMREQRLWLQNQNRIIARHMT